MHWVIKLKYWFFANYWWLLAVVAVATAVVLVLFKEPVASYAGAFGAILSIVYFVQKQKLEETKLFRDIFKECNERYDAINEALAQICDSDDDVLSAEEAALLIDYFNLCGEEYLYYRQGYIPPSVWSSWFLGMQIVICSPRIDELWRSEKATDSYYGLPLEPFNYSVTNT